MNSLDGHQDMSGFIDSITELATLKEANDTYLKTATLHKKMKIS